MSALTVVHPLTITDAILTATDVTEADYAAWASGTTYALGDRVISTATHRIYESLQASNVGHDPTSTASAAWWTTVSATNRWKIFDLANNTATAKSTSFYFTLTPGVATSAIAAVGVVDASSIRVRVTDPTDGLVYDVTTSMLGSISSSDWYAYFFDDVDSATLHIEFSLPRYPSAAIRVDFAGGPALACAGLILGNPATIGYAVLGGPRVGIIDYSRRETDDFGNVVLVQRAYAKRAELSALVSAGQRNAVYALLANLRSTPALWVASSDIDSLCLLGYYKDFEMAINYADSSDLRISIEGLV